MKKKHILASLALAAICSASHAALPSKHTNAENCKNDSAYIFTSFSEPSVKGMEYL